MDDISIRAARPQEVDRISDILNDPPNRAMMTIAGSRKAALMAGRILSRAGLALNLETTAVAVEGERIVGIMDAAAHHATRSVTPGVALRVLPKLSLAAGPAALLRLARSRAAWSRVDFEHDPASYYVAELDVEPACRNRGIGRMLLEYGEAQARAGGCPTMCLVTDIINPARRLYERQGFRVAATKTDPEFERWTGSPGRVFMVKPLT